MSEWNTEALIDTSGHFLTAAQTLSEWQVLNPKLQIPNKGSNPNYQNGRRKETAGPRRPDSPFCGIGARIRETVAANDWQR